MNRKLIAGILAFVFIALLGGAAFLYNNLKDEVDTGQLAVQDENVDNAENDSGSDAGNSDTEAEEKDDRVASLDFTIYDNEGNEVHLFDFTGKPIVLNFWASWCGPCQMEMPDFEEKFKELGDEVQFLMINMTSGREDKESADAFLAEQGYTFPVYYDLDGDAAATYGAYSLPTSYFIDAQGYVVARATGMIDGETLEEAIGLIYTR